MTIREYYVQRREAELPVFMEVFRALPEGRLDYKPADKSPTAKEIAWINSYFVVRSFSLV